ncbi:MAG: hypothetical protein E7366_00180 [Clostridiales bacterium]|nr:hypothetical protein [Clostridiales bacterium]
MADRKQNQAASKIDALYSWLSYDLQRVKSELMNELKMASVQTGALYQEMKSDKDSSSQAITQEIRFSYKQNQTIYDGLSKMLTEEVGERLNSMDQKMSALEEIQELYKDLNYLFNEGAMSKLETISEKVEMLNKIEEALMELSEKFGNGFAISEEDVQTVAEAVSEKTEETAERYNAQVMEAIEGAKIDQQAFVEEVGDKVLEVLCDVKNNSNEVSMEEIANAAAEKAVEKMMAALDMDAWAEKVANLVVEKLANETEQTYDVVLDEEGINQIAEKVSEKITSEEDATYDLVIDEEGIDALAQSITEKMGVECAPCEEVEEETVTEEVVVEVAEEAVEEVQPVEEVAEEVVEEPAKEEAVEAELALGLAPVFEEDENQLVDAETGLVLRLKRSFTAKMKQSAEEVKAYYSEIKNELISYKKINSTVSWHGDRFNFGRDTIAKINICGKTLCFYVALDPNDPEYKTTVFHQKDVSGQKAYEGTPFMIKVKSEAGAKKALRLVGYLAEKIGAEKKKEIETVDYVQEFAYESTKQLLDEGYIKATKEKKTKWNF